MGVGQLSESDAVDALRLPFYSSSHPTGSHGWRIQFDLGNPDLHYVKHLKRSLLEGVRWTMLLRISRFPIPIMLVALLAVTACGGSDESTRWDLLPSSDESAGHPGVPGDAGAPVAAAAPAPSITTSVQGGMWGDARMAARRLAWERLARSLLSCVSSSHRSNSVGPNRSRGSISRTTR